MGEILVLAEHRRGELREPTFEVLSLANKIAGEQELKVTTFFPGHEPAQLAGKLDGACDRILVMDDPKLAHYNSEQYLPILQSLIEQRRPTLTLMAHTAMGMDLAPALAARLSVPLVTDCLDLKWRDSTYEATRQLYGGKINAVLSLKPFECYMATIRTGTFPAKDQQGKSAKTETLSAPTWEGTITRRFVEYLDAALEDVDIASAEILVSVGRGIGKPENISQVEEFANSIGATLSCSRPVADKGWLPKSRQVGTSGKTVRPKIYLALGISGAFQHQAGMKNSETIIAVNKDSRAPIFKVAHYGIVADLFQVLPILTEKFAA